MITAKKEQTVVLILFSFLLLNSILVSGITAKIGNGKTILYPELTKDRALVIDRTIGVINDNDVPVNIQIIPSEEYKDIINVIDNNFTLAAGETRDAKFTITLTKTGKYEGKLNVFFTPTEEGKSGVVIASNIIMYVKGEGMDGALPGSSSGNSTSGGLGALMGNLINMGSSDDNSGISGKTLFIGFSMFLTLVLVIFLIFLISKKNKNSGANKVGGKEIIIKKESLVKDKKGMMLKKRGRELNGAGKK